MIPNFELEQLSLWRQCFRLSAASGAYSAFEAETVRELDSSNELTITSNITSLPAFQIGKKMSLGVIGFLERGFFPLLVRDLQMRKRTLFYLESGHVLQLRLLDCDMQRYVPHRCQELLLYGTGTSFRSRRQGHPSSILKP